MLVGAPWPRGSERGQVGWEMLLIRRLAAGCGPTGKTSSRLGRGWTVSDEQRNPSHEAVGGAGSDVQAGPLVRLPLSCWLLRPWPGLSWAQGASQARRLPARDTSRARDAVDGHGRSTLAPGVEAWRCSMPCHAQTAPRQSPLPSARRRAEHGEGEELARHCSLPIPNRGAQRGFPPVRQPGRAWCAPHTRRETDLSEESGGGWAGSVAERGP